MSINVEIYLRKEKTMNLIEIKNVTTTYNGHIEIKDV